MRQVCDTIFVAIVTSIRALWFSSSSSSLVVFVLCPLVHVLELLLELLLELIQLLLQLVFLCRFWLDMAKLTSRFWCQLLGAVSFNQVAVVGFCDEVFKSLYAAARNKVLESLLHSYVNVFQELVLYELISVAVWQIRKCFYRNSS